MCYIYCDGENLYYGCKNIQKSNSELNYLMCKKYIYNNIVYIV